LGAGDRATVVDRYALRAFRGEPVILCVLPRALPAAPEGGIFPFAAKLDKLDRRGRHALAERAGGKLNGGAMKTIKEILQGKPQRLLSISPQATVLDALKTMADYDVGALVVLDGERLSGIFSERDYARKVILQGKASKDTAVAEIMTHKVVCVKPEQSVEECMALMTDKRIRHLPVLEDKKVIGVISIGDVVKEVISEQRFVIEQLEQYIHS